MVSRSRGSDRGGLPCRSLNLRPNIAAPAARRRGNFGPRYALFGKEKLLYLALASPAPPNGVTDPLSGRGARFRSLAISEGVSLGRHPCLP
jgi:hypothetical protein